MAEVVVAPDPVEKDVPPEDLAGMARQVDEQIELRPGERDLLIAAVACHAPALQIDREWAETERCAVEGGITGPARRARPAPQRRADPRDQLGYLERLADVVGGPRLPPHADIHRVGPRGPPPHRAGG